MEPPPAFDHSYFLGRDSNYVFGYHHMRYRFLWQRRLRLLPRLAPSGRLLDVGCAFGFFLRWLEDRYETYGIDVSDYAVGQARRVLKSPHRIQQADVQQDIPFAQQFDLITAFDIVEHLADPAAALRRLAGALHRNGYLILEFPTQTPLFDRDGSHLYRPLSHWITLLNDVGLRIISTQQYWTIGLRIILIPSTQRANYCQMIATPHTAIP